MAKGDRIVVELTGGPPWGFRLGGGADFSCPLEIAKLRRRSKACEAGLSEGDVVIEIDNQDVSTRSHGDAMKIIELAGPTLKLVTVKGIGPSADLASSSMMNQSSLDPVQLSSALNQVPKEPGSRPLEATVVISREPSISRSYIEPTRSREPSVSRSITVISKGTQKVATPIAPANRSLADPWTVNVDSYEFVDRSVSQTRSISQPRSISVHDDMPRPAPASPVKQPPMVSPKPRFNAKQPVLIQQKRLPPPVSDKPKMRPFRSEAGYSPLSPQPQAQLPSPLQTSMFKVSKAPISKPPNRWQPVPDTVTQQPPQQPPQQYINQNQLPSQNGYHPTQFRSQPSQHLTKQPSQAYNQPHSQQRSHNFDRMDYTQRSPIPPPPPAPKPPSMMSPKPANHIPGMINPLIFDETQGDFGVNEAVRPTKKIYSDSAFYDTPGQSYPTIHEQVAKCKEIANVLESSQNRRSRGGRMFMKRKQRADEWSMDSQGQRRLQTSNAANDTMDSVNQYNPRQQYNQVRHHPTPIKSKIDAAELEQIQHNMQQLCHHDELPPNMAFDVNSALSTSHGKAGQIFARRKQRADKYVVDDHNVHQFQTPPNNLAIQIENQQNYAFSPPTGPHKSPWENAINGRLAADQPDSNAQKYKTFKPVSHTLYNNSATATSLGRSQTLPRRKTRLDQMIEDGGKTSISFNMSPPASSVTNNNYMSSNYNSGNFATQPQTHTAYNPSIEMSSSANQLRRPKDYMSQSSHNVMSQSMGPVPVSAF